MTYLNDYVSKSLVCDSPYAKSPREIVWRSLQVYFRTRRLKSMRSVLSRRELCGRRSPSYAVIARLHIKFQSGTAVPTKRGKAHESPRPFRWSSHRAQQASPDRGIPQSSRTLPCGSHIDHVWSSPHGTWIEQGGPAVDQSTEKSQSGGVLMSR